MAEKRFASSQNNQELVQPLEPELVEFMNDLEIKEGESLDRLLDQNLYLVLKRGNEYVFPTGTINKGEFLHNAAKRELDSQLGTKMDVEIVGKVPVAHTENDKEVVFYVKAYILAGKVGDAEHLWLSRDEIRAKNPKLYEELGEILD